MSSAARVLALPLYHGRAGGHPPSVEGVGGSSPLYGRGGGHSPSTEGVGGYSGNLQEVQVGRASVEGHVFRVFHCAQLGVLVGWIEPEGKRTFVEYVTDAALQEGAVVEYLDGEGFAQWEVGALLWRILRLWARGRTRRVYKLLRRGCQYLACEGGHVAGDTYMRHYDRDEHDCVQVLNLWSGAFDRVVSTFTIVDTPKPGAYTYIRPFDTIHLGFTLTP